MNRRTFLGVLGALVTLPVFGSRLRPENAQTFDVAKIGGDATCYAVFRSKADGTLQHLGTTWIDAPLNPHPFLRAIKDAKP